MASVCSSLSTAHGPAMTTGSTTADGDRPDAYHRGLRVRLPAHQLVGLGDPDGLLDAFQRQQARIVHFVLIAHNADGGPLCTRYGKAAVAQAFNLADHRIHLRFCGIVLHDDKHSSPPRRRATSLVSLIQTIASG